MSKPKAACVLGAAVRGGEWCGNCLVGVATCVADARSYGCDECCDHSVETGCARLSGAGPEAREVCDGCGQEIDPDCCGCGSVLADHTWSEHPFIPAGCDCYRSKPASPLVECVNCARIDTAAGFAVPSGDGCFVCREP